MEIDFYFKNVKSSRILDWKFIIGEFLIKINENNE